MSEGRMRAVPLRDGVCFGDAGVHKFKNERYSFENMRTNWQGDHAPNCQGPARPVKKMPLPWPGTALECVLGTVSRFAGRSPVPRTTNCCCLPTHRVGKSGFV